MSIVVYQDVATPIVPTGDLALDVRNALGASLRSMRYTSPDFAGLYQDDKGTTPVTAAGQPVGLMLDRRFGLALSSEMMVNGDFTGDSSAAWTLQSWVVSGGRLNKTAGDTLHATGRLSTPCVAGRAYLLEFDLTISASTITPRLRVGAGGALVDGPAFSASGRCRAVFTATAPHDLIQLQPNGSAFAGSIDNISVRELPGTHASQPTTTARPTLRSGPLRIDYDGVDDFLRTVFPALGSNVTIARSIPGTGAQFLTGQTIAAGNWNDNVDSCATLVIDRALTGPETALVTAFLNQQAGV